MRVLLVSHLALPHVGGVEVLIDQEIRALVADGHEVVLVTSNGSGRGQVPQYPPAVRVIRVPAWHILEKSIQLPYPLFSPEILSVLWREAGRCDVVHAHGFLFMNSVLALLLGRMRGKACVLTDHGGIQRFSSSLVMLIQRCAVETVGRLSARLATRLVTYNQRILDLLRRLGGRHKDALFLPNPLDASRFHPATPAQREEARQQLGWSDGRPRVLFVGRLIATKGVPLVLDLACPEFELVFCGPGDPAILGPLPRPGVQYLPARPQEELVRLYQSGDVLVLPAEMREGFPVVVQEALACGLPVVLAYEPGFEPYRPLPGLHFCERTSESVKRMVCKALSEPRPDQDLTLLHEFCPDYATWIERLFGGLGLPVR